VCLLFGVKYKECQMTCQQLIFEPCAQKGRQRRPWPWPQCEAPRYYTCAWPTTIEVHEMYEVQISRMNYPCHRHHCLCHQQQAHHLGIMKP